MNYSDVTKYAKSYIAPDDYLEGSLDGESLTDKRIIVLSGDEIVRCSHCDFTSNSTSSMTQHRWEVHPLLARRKQHLMKTSPKVMKRPNSQPSSEHHKGLPDDATPSKQLSLYDVTKDKQSISAKDDPSDGVYSMEDFAKEFHSIEKKTKSANSTNPGVTSSQWNHNSTKCAKLSYIDDSETAPPTDWHNKQATEYITSVVKNSPTSHLDVALRPLFMDKHLPPTPRGAAHNSCEEKPQNLSKNFHQGNFSTSSSFWASAGHKDKVGFSQNSILASKATDRDNVGGAFSLFAMDDKPPPGYLATRGMQFPTNPLSVIPYSLGGLSSSAYFPLLRNSHFLHHGLYQSSSPFLPTSLPLQMTSGVPLCVPSLASDAIAKYRRDVTMDVPLSKPLSPKISPHASERSWLADKKPFELRMTSKSSHAFPHGANAVQNNQRIKTESANVPFPVRTLIGKSLPSNQTLKSNVSLDLQRRESGSDRALSASYFPSTTSFPSKQSSKTTYTCSTLSQQRPLVAAQMMDNDRVRMLEAALRNTDCCDPNERSSVLPFRCSDGKWRMVRTKRIGAVWLVQFPDCKEPAVYLPNLNRANKTEDTLNNWLKEKLGSFKGKFVASKPESSCWMNSRQRTPESIHQRARASNISSTSINEAHNEAIRNLLLQKPALV